MTTSLFFNKSISKNANLGLALCLLLFLVFGSGENRIELIISFTTLAVIMNLFLVTQPIIFFTFSYHFIQVTAKLFYAEFSNISINTLTVYSASADMAEALRLSCVGLIFLSFSIHYFLPKNTNGNSIRLNIKKLFFIYVGLLFIEVLAGSIGQLGGFYQLVIKISILKWGILFLIIYTGIREKKYYYFISLIGLEVFVTLFSYFSTFKNALFVALISFLVLRIYYFKISAKYFLLLGGISLVMLFTWQNIKEDYRTFLSGGERSQTISVDAEEAYDKIFDLVSENTNSTASTIEKTIDRLSYIDFFAESITYIPSIKSHTNGALWLEGINHVLQPRLFFPDKKVIDDSQKTMEYTGLLLAGAEQGTSISLGYMAESYVDFGRYLFVIPIILLGLLIGWLFKILFNSGINTLYCWAFSVPFYFQFYGFEMASEKVLGSIVTYAIVVFVLVKFFSKRFAWLEE